MTSTDYVKAILATIMWREDSEDGLQGMIACGLVIRNRVRAGWNGGQWLEVMNAHDQFAGVIAAPGPARWPDVRDPKFQQVLWKVDAIFDGTELDITKGALYYAHLHLANSPWFLENITGRLDAHPRVATVGQQTFFA
jgi:hypothetical protein